VIQKEFLWMVLVVHMEACPSVCASDWVPSSPTPIQGVVVTVTWRWVVPRVVKAWRV
jgi:hypothetical protein